MTERGKCLCVWQRRLAAATRGAALLLQILVIPRSSSRKAQRSESGEERERGKGRACLCGHVPDGNGGWLLRARGGNDRRQAQRIDPRFVSSRHSARSKARRRETRTRVAHGNGGWPFGCCAREVVRSAQAQRRCTSPAVLHTTNVRRYHATRSTPAACRERSVRTPTPQRGWSWLLALLFLFLFLLWNHDLTLTLFMQRERTHRRHRRSCPPPSWRTPLPAR